MSFAAEVRHDAQGAVLTLTGDLNALAQNAFDAAAERALAGSPGELVIDFGEIAYINSTGIALIVGLLTRARSARVLVSGRNVDAHHRYIFEITNLSEFIRFEDEQPASATPRRLPP